MANDIQSYLIKLEADGAKLKTEAKASATAIDRLEKELKDLEKQQKRTGRSAKSLSKDASGMGKRMQDAASSMAVIQGPLGGVAGRMSALGAVVSRGSLKWVGLSAAIGATLAIQKRALAVFAETENQLARISSQLELTGNGVGFTTQQLDGFARQQARLTLSSSEDVREAISVLLTFRSISGETFKDAVKASNAISAITGTSVKSSAIQLGKALEDARTGLTALRRQGISFSDEQRKEIIRLADEGRQSAAMEKVIAIINEQIPDASKGVGELAGKVDQLSQSWRELLEGVAQSNLGGFLVDLSTKFAENAKNFINPGPREEMSALGQEIARSERALDKFGDTFNSISSFSKKGADFFTGIGFKQLGVGLTFLSRATDAAVRREEEKIEGALARVDQIVGNDLTREEQETRTATEAKAKQAAEEAANIARIARERDLQFASIAAKTRVKIEADRAKTETAILREQLRAGEISYADFYAKIDAFQIQSIDSQIASVNAKITSLRAENATVIQIRRETTKLVELQAKKVEIGRRNNLEVEKERANLQKELADVERQVQALTGNSLGAQIVAIDAQFANLKARLEANGASSKAVDKLIDIKKAKAGMDEINRRFKRLSESLSRDEQSIDVDLSTGALTELQAREKLVKVQEKYQRQIAELIPQAEKLAAVTENDAAIRSVEVLKDKVEELGRRTDIVATEIKGAFQGGFVDTLSSIGTDITTVDELWRSFSTNVLSSLQQIAAERLTSELFSLLPTGTTNATPQTDTGGNVGTGLGVAGNIASAAIDGGSGEAGVTAGDQLVTEAVKTTGQSQKQGIIGQLISLAASIFSGNVTQSAQATAQTVSVTSLLGSIEATLVSILGALTTEGAGDTIGDIVGALAHSGRVIGASGGASRSVPASTFAGAARFHDGGFVGLASDERPAILQTREEVLSRDDPRNALNGGGAGGAGAAPPQVNVLNVLDTQELDNQTSTFLNSGDGERLVVNIMQKNRSSLGI